METLNIKPWNQDGEGVKLAKPIVLAPWLPRWVVDVTETTQMTSPNPAFVAPSDPAIGVKVTPEYLWEPSRMDVSSCLVLMEMSNVSWNTTDPNPLFSKKTPVKCGKCGAAGEKRTCPYSEEINNESVECSCCDECRQVCLDEI